MSRSSREKLSPFERCSRTSSPSSISTAAPSARSRSASAPASVDFPAPERPVSQSVKPRRVLPPASVPGATVTDVWCVVCDMALSMSATRSHVAFAAKRLEAAAVVLVLRTPRPLGDVREATALQLDDDLLDVLRVRHDRLRARPAAERAIALAFPLVVVQAHRRNALALDVFPDVELRPIEQRVNTHVRARRELRRVLVPELGRLIGDVPVVLAGARREVALLRPATLFVGASTHDDAGVRLAIRVDDVLAELVVEAVALSLAGERATQRFGLEVAAAGQPVDVAVGERLLRRERLFV